MKYEHTCIFGATLVGWKGYKNNSCRKCRSVKGGQPKKTVIITINNIEYPIPTTHKLYNLRYKIMQRCYKAKPSEFKYYQGKGIKVCDEWRTNPISFYTWCISNGWKEGLTIDRIDSSKDYEPNNCQFISLVENAKKTHFDNSIFGENHGQSKLTNIQVFEIKDNLRNGISSASIAKNYNVSVSCIKNIKTGKTWTHI